MTTSVHIVNFGPNAVKIKDLAEGPGPSVHIVNFGPNAVKIKDLAEGPGPDEILYSQASSNRYVFDGHSIQVEEIKMEKETK
jgi:hypothetical protein